MVRSLSVAVVVPRFPPFEGGIETHVERIAARLPAHGVRAEIFTSTDGSRLVQEDHGEFRVHRFPLPVKRSWDLPSLAMFKALRAELGRFDIVHAHNYHALPALYAAVAKGRTPFVFTPHYHGTGRTSVRKAMHVVYRPAGRRVVARADRIVAVSTIERDLLINHFGQAVAERTTVVPNGVDSLPSSVAPFPRRRRTVLTIARLEKYKAVDALIRMMPQLPGDVELVVVGDGSQRWRLQRLASTMKVGSRVFFTGRVEDAELDRWRATAAVFVSASIYEAFGITVAEALSLGIPVVVSDIPAHREVVGLVDGQARAFLVPPGPDAPRLFAEAVRDALALRAERVPARMPSWTDVTERTVELYQGLTTGRSYSARDGFCEARPGPSPGTRFHDGPVIPPVNT
jgi:glycosyltransferase involved in cell wall biosynthesis